MIIGTIKYDINKVKGLCNDRHGLLTYVDSLVPKWANHIEHIIDNQRYYVAVTIRKTLSIPYKQRMQIANELLQDITLGGISNKFITIDDIINLCDKDDLISMFKEILRDEEI